MYRLRMKNSLVYCRSYSFIKEGDEIIAKLELSTQNELRYETHTQADAARHNILMGCGITFIVESV